MRAQKQFFQGMLKRAGVYQRLKASHIYDLYWGIADRRVIEARRREVDFYRNLLHGLRRGDLIFDIGANHGTKTDVFLRLGARVISVEPDELNQEILREKFLAYRFVQKPVDIVGKAVSDKVTSVTMWIDGPGSALNTLSQKWVDTLKEDKERFVSTHDNLEFARCKIVETTTLEELMSVYGSPAFIKIDVEGHEASVLRGLKRAVPFVSFEINLPEFRPEGLEGVEILARLAPEGRFNYTTDCQHGLALGQWLDARAFSSILEACSESTIEVFWKAVDSYGR
jgi:FkbM family methyltransferase